MTELSNSSLPELQPGWVWLCGAGPGDPGLLTLHAVNALRQGTIGRVTPLGAGEVFLQLPAGSIGNGIRFDANGFFYVADYTQHNVLRVDPTSRDVTVFAQNSDMNQPNDLAINAEGTLYASDPNWQAETGQIWRIDLVNPFERSGCRGHCRFQL